MQNILSTNDACYDINNYTTEIPHITKYMGSKKQILNFVISGIQDSYLGEEVCDLFAGSSIISGALRNSVPVISNDIQHYSSILANTYTSSYDWNEFPNLLIDILDKAHIRTERFLLYYPELNFDYSRILSIDEFNELEKSQQNLINKDFSNFRYHLFTKNYSGTYWSYNQCVWIDSFREVAEDYKDTSYYYAILSSLMFAMSYSSQSTGHYAQYRDAHTNSAMKDIHIYRQKSIPQFFRRKFEELKQVLNTNSLPHQVTSLDYLECLKNIGNNTTVYADPPYCFVHYSRFYHALETLIHYDYPKVKYKGRYRVDRHQSPFCIKTKVDDAFKNMFTAISEKKANLVLSYSNTGMIELTNLLELAKQTLDNQYTVEVRTQNYLHSTMGRREDGMRDVQEYLILFKKKNN